MLLQICDFRCSEARGRPWLLLALLVAAWLAAFWIGRRRKGGSTMKAAWKIGVVVLLVAAVVGVFAMKRGGSGNVNPGTTDAVTPAAMATGKEQPSSEQAQALPRLVDLGSDTCIPCKMMIPVLDELTKEYAGRLRVEFINVRENPGEGAKYGIKLIPTQIFIDAAGKELFRHEGFFSKEDILAKWKEFGVDLSDVREPDRRPSSDSRPPSPTSVRRKASATCATGTSTPRRSSS